MWFTRFSEYVNRSWKEASLVAFIFSLIPFMGWVGIVIMALVTMRKGRQAGLFILLVISIPSLVFLGLGMNTPWVIAVLAGNILTWILAQVLRSTADWGKVILASMVAAVAVVLVLQLVVPDLRGYWFDILHRLYVATDRDATALLQSPPSGVDLKKYLLTMAKIIMPMLLMVQVLMSLINLLLARLWQASLFNPGGLAGELPKTRLSAWATLLLVAVALAVYMGFSAGWDVLPTMIVLFFLVGVIVFHNLMMAKKANTVFFWLFYGLMVLLFPYSIAMVAGLGIADSLVDFRVKDTHSTKNGEK